MQQTKPAGSGTSGETRADFQSLSLNELCLVLRVRTKLLGGFEQKANVTQACAKHPTAAALAGLVSGAAGPLWPGHALCPPVRHPHTGPALLTTQLCN